MKNLKSWITTSIGIFLIIGTIYEYFWKDVGTVQALIVFAIGFFFLQASDRKIKEVVNSIGTKIKSKLK